MRVNYAVHPEADRVLCIWAEWKQRLPGVMTMGYPKRAAGFLSGGSTGEDAFEHLCEAVDIRVGTIADAIIDDLSRRSPRLGLAILNRYIADVATMRGDPVALLAEATTEFLAEGRRRGICVE